MNRKYLVKFISKIKKNMILYSLIRRIRNLALSIIPKYYHFNNKKLINYSFQKNYSLLIEDSPIANQNSYFKKSNLNVAIITDEYMYNYYKDALKLIYLTPDNYVQVINNNRIDFVLFISCWKGLSQNDWHGNEKRSKVIEIFNYAKQKEIKTVFQTIEDPSNYDIFINIAKFADYIFTAAIEKIEDYIQDTNNKNVFLLDYGINPLLHNPIGFLNKYKFSEKYELNSVFFAGSWAPRYQRRCEDMQNIFDGILDTENWNLIIADRNMYIKGYKFPKKYQRYLIPPIEHQELQKVHKLFNWTVNLNSIQNSMTMCAMRVYEIQALGSLILSNYALSINNSFPNVFTIIEKKEIKKILNNYRLSEIINMQLIGVRNVYTEHTVYDKLNYIFDNIKLDYKFKPQNVYILCENKTANILKIFKKQSYEFKKLYTIKEFCSLSKIESGYFIILDSNQYYNPNYILDLINAFKFTDGAYVNYINNNEIFLAYNYTKNLNTKCSTLYNMKKVSLLDVLNDNVSNLNGFSILEPIYDTNKIISEKELGVVIPVFNNGRFLRDRSFNSLLRSSIFNKMNIYIIDDGSTHKETLDIIDELDRHYNNVITYYFNDGGSGSASRPRNVGLVMCEEKYITYLDPDNEAINDGYAVLLEDIKKNNVDIAFGTIYKVSDTINKLSFMNEDKIIFDPKKELLKRNFKSQSIQACVINRDLIIKNNIINPIGALGQDTLFFYELMLNAKQVYHRMLPIHIYYAQRQQSVVNNINKTFFEKFFILEKYQVSRLKKYNVLEEYKIKKLGNFINNWYLEKLKYAEQSVYNEIVDIINEIKQLYDI